jgi:hypothetical protein
VSIKDNPTKYDETQHYVVVATRDGFVLDEEDIEEFLSDVSVDPSLWDDDQAPDTIVIVTGSAIPRSQSRTKVDDFHRLPSSWQTKDKIEILDYLDEYDVNEIVEKLDKAKRMAAGLNA